MSDPNVITPATPEQGYDRHDARAGLVGALAGGTIIVLVALIIGVYVFYVLASEKVHEDQVGKVYSEELKGIHAREEEQLNHYGYIDKEKGLVRLPIDRAMDIVAAEYAAGTVRYNTKTYPLKPELPQGVPAVPGAAPATAPAAATTAK